MKRVLLLVALLIATGCYSFAGGGLPAHVRTVAVLPFDNESGSPELPRELQDALRDGMQSRLGLRDASEERASAIVRGRITRYEFDIPVAFSADPTQATSARRRLRVQVNIEIVDQVTGRVLWSRSGMTAEGEYAERNEVAGRRQAIDRIVNDVIEGAQSQW
ncbi:LPS assembly lipoprotein LptE [Pseudogemmatithrix spongiicola]|uniref:LPS assembly lipoprotein LptE n=1 Tax=Pseudogemmatithrix spongiicola TaxID=3062599 RepID=A0AA49K085_9BACT|nr:LPS assembly lipoprotein LptE [Gemmatimonadaceae bacterium 'strain 138']WKW15032.1 LPS assembly lipoprotein LptE [Gemmatimonadaceae bacterium 'strain 318']